MSLTLVLFKGQLYIRYRKPQEPETKQGFSLAPSESWNGKRSIILPGTWPITEALVLFNEKTELGGKLDMERRNQFIMLNTEFTLS